MFRSLIVALAVAAFPATAHAIDVTIDATQLDVTQFNIAGVPGAFPNDRTHVVNLTPGQHEFAVFAGGASGTRDLFFDVDAAGNVSYDAAAEKWFDGTGTNTLTVHGFDVTFDVTALSYSRVSVDPFLPDLDVANATTLRLPPNGGPSHWIFQIPGGGATGTKFNFTVDFDGNLQFDASYDAFLDGRGTTTMTAVGFDVTIDATALSYGAASAVPYLPPVDPDNPTTFRLLPDIGISIHQFEIPGGGSNGTKFNFTVDFAGNVQYEAALEDFFNGAGSDTLTAVGYDVTIDGSPLSYQLGLAIRPFLPTFTGSRTFRLMPNSGTTDHALLVPGGGAQGTHFSFTVDFAGNVQYDPSFGNFITGAGTNTLTAVGYDVNFDASALPYQFGVDLGPWLDRISGLHTFRMMPNTGTTIHQVTVPGGGAMGASFAFTLDLDGNVQYPAEQETFLAGAGTDTLVLEGCPITFDGRNFTEANFELGPFLGFFPKTPPTTLNLVPNRGIEHYAVRIGGVWRKFTVGNLCTVDYASPENDVFSGRGTSTLFIGRIPTEFVLTYDPDVDGVEPDPVLNTALYDPASHPGKAVGTLPSFPSTDPIQAVTELFFVGAADATYRDIAESDILGLVAPGQRIRILISVAQADSTDPSQPDPSTETVPFEVAIVEFQSGNTIVTITGSLADSVPVGSYPFCRVKAVFEYDDPIEAELGPFAVIDEVKIPIFISEEAKAPVFELPTDPPCNSTFEWVAGKELTFDIKATDENAGDVITLDVTGLPAGATLTPALPTNGNPAQTTFSWTPAESDAGEHTITFSATDSSGRVVTCSFDIEVTWDRDGDGLPDFWEECGFTAANGDFVDLPAMGADPDRKDIFVEVDYMAGQMPQQQAIDMVVDAFANAPLANPDGTTGITLHVRLGNEITFQELLGSESASGVYDWDGSNPGVTYFHQVKLANFPPGLAQTAHYCLFAHKLDFGDKTVSGMSRGGEGTGFAASEFVVSLGGVGVGGVGSVAQQAGTLMHELGHDLGLRHGGGDSINRKPNYLSVMNHSFQMSGLIGGGFDFSCCKLPDLDENSKLDESAGLNGGPAIAGLGTKWFCSPTDPRTTADANGPIDWNCNDTIDTALVKTDINADGLPAGFSGAPVLTGFNDWENIVFVGGAVGSTGATLPPPPPVTEPPPEVDEEIITAVGPPAPQNIQGHPTDPQTTLTWSPVAPPGGGKVTYNVYRTEAGEVVLLASTTQTNYHDKDKAVGVEYEYSVATVDEFGTEGPAASVVVMSR
jgi:hypothetical protein